MRKDSAEITKLVCFALILPIIKAQASVSVSVGIDLYLRADDENKGKMYRTYVNKTTPYSKERNFVDEGQHSPSLFSSASAIAAAGTNAERFFVWD